MNANVVTGVQSRDPDYGSILHWYQQRLTEHGDSHLGIGWPDQQKAEAKYAVMMGIVPPTEPATLLDLGCGPGRMLDWMLRETRWPRLTYTGIDFNPGSIVLAREKHPTIRFIQKDVLREPLEEQFDYTIMNGVLTMKAGMSFDEMWDYTQRLLTRVYAFTRRAIAFNIMSKTVDWERDDLFHLPTDMLIDFAAKHLSRKLVIRHDYAPYEYTAYVYR